eukprot:CFRG3722T1
MMVGKGTRVGNSGTVRSAGAPEGADGDKPRHYMYTNRQVFDGKRMRKAVQRHTVDYFNTCTRYLEARNWKKDIKKDLLHLQPDMNYSREILPPYAMQSTPVNSVTTKLAHTSTNKVRRPTFTCTWTPEGRRLITGASSGEFTLWNGLTFNFETILQAHDQAVRSMMWSHNDNWMVTGDHGGVVKYWQANMNNVKEFQAHRDAIRGMAFSPNDSKFVTGGDDSLLKVWDFATSQEERTLTGHGWDVKCLDWHPQKGLIVSGSKDNNVKFWDPRTGSNVHTVHPHKDTILSTKFNRNGNWLLTCSRDQLVKVYDMRTLRELDSFKGHRKEVNCVAWHPVHERLFVSGCAEGSIFYWLVGNEKEAGSSIRAHESNIWDLSWHPMGHMLASASNDHSTKFWTRNPLGGNVADGEYSVTQTAVPLDSIPSDNTTSQMNIPGLGSGKDSTYRRQSIVTGTPRGGGNNFTHPRPPYQSGPPSNENGPSSAGGVGRGYDNPNVMGGYRPLVRNASNNNGPRPPHTNGPPTVRPPSGGPPTGGPPSGGAPTGGPPSGGAPASGPPPMRGPPPTAGPPRNQSPNILSGHGPPEGPPPQQQQQWGGKPLSMPSMQGNGPAQPNQQYNPRQGYGQQPPNRYGGGAPSVQNSYMNQEGGPPPGQEPFMHPQRQANMNQQGRARGWNEGNNQNNRGRPY